MDAEYIDNTCPCCGEPLKVKKYYEEVHGYKVTVETDAKCPCGYHYNCGYGVIEITMPEYAEEEA